MEGRAAQRARESGYQRLPVGALTAAQVRRLLGIETRYELDRFFKEHGVYLNYSIEDLERDTRGEP